MADGHSPICCSEMKKDSNCLRNPNLTYRVNWYILMITNDKEWLQMNETVNTLKDRYSVKNYASRQVPDDLLDAVLEAGLYAPSGLNNQKTVMVAVRDKQTRDLLAELNRQIRGVESDTFYGAPCVIVVLADPNNGTWVEDGSLVMGNLLNAAHSLGLAGCWIHRARETFDLPEGKKLLEQWGVPGHYRGVGNCILGYAAGETVRKNRQDGRIIKIN